MKEVYHDINYRADMRPLFRLPLLYYENVWMDLFKL